MIRRQDIFRTRAKNGVQTHSSHVVKITISGRSDLDSFAALIEQGGKPNWAAAIRRRRSFTITVSPEQAADLLETKK
jgi:hypothetical protein